MKIKNILICLFALSALAVCTVRAEVLVEDNFDSYVNLPPEMLTWDFASLCDADPNKWISPFAGVASAEVKVGPGEPNVAYYSGNNSMDTELRLYRAISTAPAGWGSDYTVSADFYQVTNRHTGDDNSNGIPDYEEYVPYVYVGGRITDTTYVIGGIALTNYDPNGPRYVYARLKDSDGASVGDYYVGQLSPELPVSITLTLSGQQASVTVSHAGMQTVVNLTTTVLDNGAPGFGAQRPWGGYGKAYFDDFIATGDVYQPALDGDISGDDTVNFIDFAMLAADWAKCTNPADSNCDQYWK